MSIFAYSCLHILESKDNINKEVYNTPINQIQIEQ